MEVNFEDNVNKFTEHGSTQEDRNLVAEQRIIQDRMLDRVESFVRVKLTDEQGDLPLPEFSKKKTAEFGQLHGLMTRFKAK